MPSCQKCGESWTWSQTVKRAFSFRRIMNCPNCNEIQYESQSSRYKTSCMILMPILPLPLFLLFELSFLKFFFIDLMITFVILAVLPFTLGLSNQDEPMW